MRFPYLLVGTASLSAIGCGINAAADAPDADVSASTSAIVVVDRTVGPGEASRGDAVVARFLRVRGGIDDATLRLAGVANEVPAIGTCSAVLDASPTAPARPVDLLDVGTVSIDGTDLGQRVMPDTAGLVSGVFYSKTANDFFVPGARLTLRAAGGKDLSESFTASVSAPRDVVEVRVSPAAGGLEIGWEALDGTSADRVYVDIAGRAGSRLRCATTDSGHVFAPSTLDEGTVAVHRVRVEPFVARGIERGEVRFDVSRVVAFHR